MRQMPQGDPQPQGMARHFLHPHLPRLLLIHKPTDNVSYMRYVYSAKGSIPGIRSDTPLVSRLEKNDVMSSSHGLPIPDLGLIL